METAFKRLFSLSEQSLLAVEQRYRRPIYDLIGWEDALTGLVGARGVGKTTLLLQRMQALGLPPDQALYVDLGDVYFQENRLLDFAVEFLGRGGRYLFIDEVHRYGFGSWAQELKQLYDVYRQRLTIAFTGSSAIRLLEQNADLSRRALLTRVPGLSLREYLLLKEGLDFPITDLRTLVAEGAELARSLLSDHPDFRPRAVLDAYCQSGYYPFFLQGESRYALRLNEIVQIVLQTDIPSAIPAARSDYQRLGRLLYAVASAAPFKPNVSKLAERLGTARERIVRYLDYLERGQLITGLRREAAGISALGKPDKLYLQNPNLLYALAPHEVNVGTVRETFFLSHLQVLTQEVHPLPPQIRLPAKGDFAYQAREGRILFEIGGPNKTHRQIGRDTDHRVVTDTELSGGEGRLPLWLFGLLY